MARLLLRLGLGSCLSAALLCGCHKNAVQHKEPPDPLLVTKKPVEGRPRSPETTTAWNEPTPPPVPDHEVGPLTAPQHVASVPGPPLMGPQAASDGRR